MVATNALAPGVIVIRSARSLAATSGEMPLSSPTRCLSDGSNSISPRIVRSVIAATSVPRPISAARMSMHSCSIRVESMSATRSRLRRDCSGTTLTSIGPSRSSDRTPARMPGSGPSKGMSQASSGESQTGDAARPPLLSSARRARSTWPSVSRAFIGATMSDRTWAMEISLDRVGEARAVLIAGATASGKSAAGLRLAEAAAGQGRSAWIINADSMQVYDALRILTARPGAAEEARAPHRLYGHVPAETRYSVGAWLTDVAAVLAEAEQASALPIVVGGTGLYFKALTDGLAMMPPIDAGVRAHW